MMEWSNFVIDEEAGKDFVFFETKIAKSIFEAMITTKTNWVSLTELQKNLIKLSQQDCSTVVFVSSDEVLRVELRRDQFGHIYQKIVVTEPNSMDRLTINDSFDQTFLPELVHSISQVLMMKT